MLFFDRFRRGLSRFSVGVHDLGAPAPAADIAAAASRLGSLLPEAYRDFLAQWNGGALFLDDYTLFGVATGRPELDRLAMSGPAELWFGEAPDATLHFDAQGRVLARDAETEDLLVIGGSFEGWLDAVFAREALVYDHEGEFRDEAFDGGELSQKARRKRAQLAAKADPRSAAWQVELAQLGEEEELPEVARAAWRRATELDEGCYPAWLSLARADRAAGDTLASAVAFEHAAAARAEKEEVAYALASAARERGRLLVPGDAAPDEAAAVVNALAARVLAAHPGFIDEQRAAAAHLVEEGAIDEAFERLELAAAVLPGEASLLRELSKLRARRALRPIG